MHRKETPRFNWQPHGSRDPRPVFQSSKGCDPAAERAPIHLRPQLPSRVAGELPVQPRAGGFPVALHGVGGYVENLCDFLLVQTTEEAHFDDLRFPWVY